MQSGNVNHSSRTDMASKLMRESSPGQEKDSAAASLLFKSQKASPGAVTDAHHVSSVPRGAQGNNLEEALAAKYVTTTPKMLERMNAPITPSQMAAFEKDFPKAKGKNDELGARVYREFKRAERLENGADLGTVGLAIAAGFAFGVVGVAAVFAPGIIKMALAGRKPSQTQRLWNVLQLRVNDFSGF